jgi:hypothetical protein
LRFSSISAALSLHLTCKCNLKNNKNNKNKINYNFESTPNNTIKLIHFQTNRITKFHLKNDTNVACVDEHTSTYHNIE